MTLPEYVMLHTERGECRCGKCIDAHEGPEPKPTDHTVNMIFFQVSASEHADKDEFRRLTKEHHGDFAQVDPFDGREHSYLELGAWIGDQGISMQYMALGVMLGVFELQTPNLILGLPINDPIVTTLAERGLVCVIAPPQKAAASCNFR